MRRRRVLSVSQSLKLTGPANVARSSKCTIKEVCCIFMYFFLCILDNFSLDAVMNKCFSANITPSPPLMSPSSAFKACHPKVKSFYFAADGVDDMNR